ncbi:cation-binding protein [Amycolatopsis antarctica]|uniref:Cation-binding protein n=1 Tax=Amycolatopsis antarctica TaxID=1854586 RepID=A0A263D0Z9_9PSEU|nr:hemerythrin domain-containing protein [Amycolatopsis antarctica]OZM71798.1 cation-binding protein [Amycolatopsis antarctica]
MADITSLILDDHDWFRRQFAALDDLTDPGELAAVWRPLADLLDVHAAAEESVFYPELIRRGEDAEDETLDAVGDHNDIRGGAHDADLHPVGSAAWHAAVRRAREANSEHMAEEEDDALADFRRHADPGLREELGRRFLAFKEEHAGTRGLDVGDVDPERYVREVEAEQGTAPSADSSLGIGSLKDQA